MMQKLILIHKIVKIFKRTKNALIITYLKYDNLINYYYNFLLLNSSLNVNKLTMLSLPKPKTPKLLQ
jgi:hypothetical protein